MKKYLIILIGIFLFSCNQKKKNTSERFEYSTEINTVNENFDWLVGNWKRLSNDLVKVTFENWKKRNECKALDANPLKTHHTKQPII